MRQLSGQWGWYWYNHLSHGVLRNSYSLLSIFALFLVFAVIGCEDPIGKIPDDGGGDTPDNPIHQDNQEYVDLGLPSGTLWATCNVGSLTPEGSGYYFAWGETSAKTTYNWATYKWANAKENTLTKYCTSSSYGTVDNKTTLDPEDDAARANMGEGWRMPTKTEQDELRNECNWVWTKLNDVRGYKVVGPNGKSIFLPAVGYRDGNSVSSVGSYSDCWSLTLYLSNNNEAFGTYFDSTSLDWSHGKRYVGRCVRGVRGTYSESELKPKQEPEQEPTGYTNDYAYVDLGLTSGTLWATCNVGASSAEENGYYFAWGETEQKPTYDWSTYKWCNGSENTMTRYCTNSSYGHNDIIDDRITLGEFSDDVAHATMGNGWRMPSINEQEELRSECTWTWTTLGGKGGYKVVGPNGNFIFLPAAGYHDGNSLKDVGSDAYYWSSSLNQTNNNNAHAIGLQSNNMSIQPRYRGYSVRGVRCAIINANATNGHEFVDLGLPSGVMWATCNVGAKSFEEYGDLFAWGETEPKTTYDWSTYKWCNDGESEMTKYCTNMSYGNNSFIDGKAVLEFSDDAAQVNMGGAWRMPTSDELNELKTECSWSWTTLGGKNGYKVVGPNGNFIFLPAAGFSFLGGAGTNGYYLSSSLSMGSDCAIALQFRSNAQNIYWSRRCYGLSVRGVIGRYKEPALETEQEPTGYNNGHAYIDLGLPSGTKWASCNVGATIIEGYGGYFAWGETEQKSTYDWSTYKWCNGSESSLTKYCNNSNYGNNGFTDSKYSLDLSDDAARVNMGGDWRMPTFGDLYELLEYCYWICTTRNNVYGYQVVSVINGNYIFLPAGGIKYNSATIGSGRDGYYWTSWYSMQKDYPHKASFFGFLANQCGDGFYNRYYGLNVRGVLGPDAK